MTVQSDVLETGQNDGLPGDAGLSPGPVWTPTTLPMTAAWAGIAHGNRTFVTYAPPTTGPVNQVATSPDGTKWALWSAHGKTPWAAMTYGNGRFVALEALGPTAYTSPDGVTWSKQDLNFSGFWTSMAHGNGKFVAVGTSANQTSESMAATSPDGASWTAVTLPAAASLASVAYGNGKFVAVGTSANQGSEGMAAISSDGINWTVATLPGTTGVWQSVAYGNGIFVAVACNGARHGAISSDGVKWTTVTLPDSSVGWYSVAYGNSRFVAVNSGDVSAISQDGINWTAVSLPAPVPGAGWLYLAFGNGKFVAIQSGSNQAATLPASVWKAGKLPATQNWISVAYGTVTGKGVFVAVANDTDRAAYSSDGLTWQWSQKPNLLPSGTGWLSVAYGTVPSVDDPQQTREVFVAVCGHNSDVGAVSDDGGKTWTKVKLPAKDHWCSVAYGFDSNGKGTFVAIANNSQNAAYSQDGVNWHPMSLPRGDYWSAVGYGNNTFVAVAQNTHETTWSGDTSSKWKLQGLGQDSAALWKSVAFGDGVFVVVGLPQGNPVGHGYNLATSPDGKKDNWTLGRLLNSNDWCSVVYGNGTFCTIGRNTNQAAISTDKGATWILQTLPGSPAAWRSVAYGTVDGNEVWVAVAYDSDKSAARW